MPLPFFIYALNEQSFMAYSQMPMTPGAIYMPDNISRFSGHEDVSEEVAYVQSAEKASTYKALILSF